LRYRYEFAPQSELFLVYSRGAGYEPFGGPDADPGSSFDDGLRLETDSQFLLKVRYRFEAV